MPIQLNKNQSYDSTVSLERFPLTFGASVAGAGGTFGKYFARGNETVWAAGASQLVAGASTYVSTNTTVQSGTYTTAVNTNTAATQITAFIVNYALTGTTTTTSTTTSQPFVVAAANGTLGAVALNNWTSLTTGGATGGINLYPGALLYMVNGTDATATVNPLWDISYSPLSNIGA